MPQPTTIRYVGPSTEVYAVDLRAHVKRGETVDVADPVLAANLLAQEGTWAPVDTRTTKPVAGAKED
jgi:hypothetical protein